MSPFPFFKSPQNRREAQSNANHMFWELMGARANLSTADQAGDAHTGILASRDVKAWEAMYAEAKRQVRRFEK